MSRERFYSRVGEQLADIESKGLSKVERVMVTAQSGTVSTAAAGQVLNLCANNYLGLADHPDIVAAASNAMQSHGYGMASVRFICGTQDIHRLLEADIASFVGTEDAQTFAACFDANGGVFEPLFGANDAIVSDSLNHASIIDGIRLSKARRYRFESRNLDDLRNQLVNATEEGADSVVIATDGVFSMDGFVADLASICELADEFGALVMVDDCHATGVVGPQGRGTPSLHGVRERVDILTSTLGKALGGGMGGFIAGRHSLVELLRQRARPYLFSNALAPGLVGGARAAIAIAERDEFRREQLARNRDRFRTGLEAAGFQLTGEGHPIIPIMIGEAPAAVEMAAELLKEQIYVTPFSYPVVPLGSARIRTQMSAAHSDGDIDAAIEGFARVGKRLGLVS